MLPSNHRKIIEQAKFIYSLLGKMIEEQREKQIKVPEKIFKTQIKNKMILSFQKIF